MSNLHAPSVIHFSKCNLGAGTCLVASACLAHAASWNVFQTGSSSNNMSHESSVDGAVGRVKKPTVAATKQWARQVRWQQRAQEQINEDSPQAPSQPANYNQARSNLGKPQGSSATSSLLAAICKQDKADKYIDRILRKQGGKLHKFRAAPVPPATAAGAKAKQQQHGQQAATGVMAELQALNRSRPVDEDIYDSEQDEYFSDDDGDA